MVLYAAQELLIQFHLLVRGDNDQTSVRFHPGQQIIGFYVGIAVMAVLHRRTFPEDRVGLVKEKDQVFPFSQLKDSQEIFFGFADVTAHHTLKIHLIDPGPELSGQDFRGHGFPRPTRPGEQRQHTRGPAGHFPEFRQGYRLLRFLGDSIEGRLMGRGK